MCSYHFLKLQPCTTHLWHWTTPRLCTPCPFPTSPQVTPWDPPLVYCEWSLAFWFYAHALPEHRWFWTQARHSSVAGGKVAVATGLLWISDSGGSLLFSVIVVVLGATALVLEPQCLRCCLLEPEPRHLTLRLWLNYKPLCSGPEWEHSCRPVSDLNTDCLFLVKESVTLTTFMVTFSITNPANTNRP